MNPEQPNPSALPQVVGEPAGVINPSSLSYVQRGEVAVPPADKQLVVEIDFFTNSATGGQIAGFSNVSLLLPTNGSFLGDDLRNVTLPNNAAPHHQVRTCQPLI